MTKIKEENLENIKGGTTSQQTISGPILQGIIKIIEMIREAGYEVGSGIRRFSEDELCPLE